MSWASSALPKAAAKKMPWLREVRSFGEAVSQEMRDYIRGKWNLPLTDVYSARETGYMAIQCPDQDTYHVQAEGAYVEGRQRARRRVRAGRDGGESS